MSVSHIGAGIALLGLSHERRAAGDQSRVSCPTLCLARRFPGVRCLKRDLSLLAGRGKRKNWAVSCCPRPWMGWERGCSSLRGS